MEETLDELTNTGLVHCDSDYFLPSRTATVIHAVGSRTTEDLLPSLPGRFHGNDD
jgi:hypothetical protein